MLCRLGCSCQLCQSNIPKLYWLTLSNSESRGHVQNVCCEQSKAILQHMNEKHKTALTENQRYCAELKSSCQVVLIFAIGIFPVSTVLVLSCSKVPLS